MGYGHYTLPDGREAGYLVEAECDQDGCPEQIDRGLAYLCGDNPDGHRPDSEWGCGLYFCGKHETSHDCPSPLCGEDTPDDDYCALVAGHDGEHTTAP
jgi:hypothetical protein